MKKVALHNLGCKVNAYETEAMQEMLEKEGYEIVPFKEGADVYIINTCTVTNMADKKSRQMLHRAKKMNPNSIVVAAGCFVQVKGEDKKVDEAIDVLIGNNKKQDLIPLLKAFEEKQCLIKLQEIGNSTVPESKDTCCGSGECADCVDEKHVESAIIDINREQEYESLAISRTSEHTRAYLKVQDGCNQFCTYCIIPFARGRIRSRKLEEVIEEVKILAAGGTKEVVLTGIHLSSYGVDFAKEPKLLELIQAVYLVSGIERIRLGSLEPRIVTEEFARELSKIKKICPHFHLSLQSGCDETLKRMNRRYTTKEYMEACEILRKYFDNVTLTTDSITGFPGETAEEFAKTRAFVEEVGFYETHVFKYSKREGTKAAVMENQVDEQVKGQRSAELIALGNNHKKKVLESFKGRKVSVLIEEKIERDGIEYVTGHTKEYFRVEIPYVDQKVNDIVEIEMK